MMFPNLYSTRLRQEIDDDFPPKEGKVPADDITKLAGMPYLNGIMYVLLLPQIHILDLYTETNHYA